MDAATQINDCHKIMPNAEGIATTIENRNLSTNEIVTNGLITTNLSQDFDLAAETPAVSNSTVLAIDKLRRFCYLGEVNAPVYVPKPLDLTVERNFAALCELCADVSERELVECLGSLLNQSNEQPLPRNDEALLVLAIYLSTRSDQRQRTMVRGHFVEFVCNDRELFLFAKFAKRVQKVLERPAFNRTIRKAILQWYKHQTVDNLLRMWSMNENDYSTHHELLKRCSFNKKTFKAETMAALNVLSLPLKVLINWPDKLEPVAKHKKLILGIAQLRLAHKHELALPIMKELSLTYDQVPRRFMKKMPIVNFVHGTMTFEQLLQTWPIFHRVYKSNRNALAKYNQHFYNMLKLPSYNVEPMRLLLQEARVQRNVTRIVRGVVLPKPPSFIQNLYKESFGCNKAFGLRMHITLNLEALYIGKSLTGRCRLIKYLDAVVAIAFGYFKSDPLQVNVRYWNDLSGALVPLPWLPTMSVDEAKTCCQGQKVTKIKQTLTDVIDSALNDAEKTYDVFLVLVPCATRGNPGRSSATLCERLDEYRLTRNENAKFIILSLRKNQQSMSYSKLRNENILEICSICDETPRLINAFANGKFF